MGYIRERSYSKHIFGMNMGAPYGPLGNSAPPSPRPIADKQLYYQWFQLADLGKNIIEEYFTVRGLAESTNL